MLTALHLVAELEQSIVRGTPVWRDGPHHVYLGFDGEHCHHESTAQAVPSCWSVALDWVLLELDEPAVNIPPIQLTAAAQLKSEWSAFGFPDVHRTGLMVTGHIADPQGRYKYATGAEPADAMQLHCVEAAASTIPGLGGLSGAPCIAGTGDESYAAYGLIRNSMKTAGGLDHPGAVLWACPAAKILEVCGDRLGDSAAPSKAAQQAIRRLRKVHEERNLVLVLGPGTSMLPTMSRLVTELSAEVADIAPPGLLETVRAHCDERAYGRALESLKTELQFNFAASVEEIWADLPGSSVATVQPIMDALVALRHGVKAVLTTNLDPGIARAFQWPHHTTTRYPQDMARRRNYVLYLHGVASEPDSWILGRRKHEKLHQDSNLWVQLSQLFATSTLLFVGWDLDAQPTTGYGKPLVRSFEKIRVNIGDRSHSNYAFYPRRTLSRERLSDLYQSRLRGVPYVGPPFGALETVLAEIGEDPSWPVTETADPPGLDPSIYSFGGAEKVLPGRAIFVPVAPRPQVVRSTAVPEPATPRPDSTPVPPVARPVSKPISSGTSNGDLDPGETKPGETKPGETKPGETKPGETKPGETKPGESDPTDVPTRPTGLPRWVAFTVGGVSIATVIVVAIYLSLIRTPVGTTTVVDAAPLDASPQGLVADAAPPAGPTWSVQLLLPAVSDDTAKDALTQLLKRAFERNSPTQAELLRDARISVIDETSAQEGARPAWSEIGANFLSGKVRVLQPEAERASLASFARRLHAKPFRPDDHDVVILVWPSDADKGWTTIPKALRPRLKKQERNFRLYVLYTALSPALANVRKALAPDAFVYIGAGAGEQDAVAAQLIEAIDATTLDACAEDSKPLACVVQAEANAKELKELNKAVLKSLCSRDKHPLHARACAVLANAEGDEAELLVGCQSGVGAACAELLKLDKKKTTRGKVVKAEMSSCLKSDQIEAFATCEHFESLVSADDVLADRKSQLQALERTCSLLGRGCDKRRKILPRVVSVTVTVPDTPAKPLPSSSRALYAYTRFRKLLLTQSLTRSLRKCWVNASADTSRYLDGREVSMEVGFRNEGIYTVPGPVADPLDACVIRIVTASEAARWQYDASYSWSALLQVKYQVVARRVATATRHSEVRRPKRPARKFQEHLSTADARFDFQERMMPCWAAEPDEMSSLQPVDVTYDV